jgi:protein-glucosylgalactosylhydroxylysine glucosidase
LLGYDLYVQSSSRRQFIRSAAPLALAARTAGAATPIDREKVVRRNNPVITALDPFTPLSVGNGEFLFTADVTGLQTFPEACEQGIPLCTQSQWGWHSVPAPDGQTVADLRLQEYETHGRKVGYPTSPHGQERLFNWLRQNPHRLHLGRIGLRLHRPDGGPAAPADLRANEQTLDLWSGVLSSRFELNGLTRRVETVCHPAEDMVAVNLRTGAPREVVFEFPYGSPQISAADWKSEGRHKTTVISEGPGRLVLRRELDGNRYSVRIGWEGTARLTREGPHRFLLEAGSTGRFAFVCHFSPEQPSQAALPSFREVLEESRAHWADFWSSGGAVDLSAAPDPRWKELERRIVLSQYLTAVQCAGSLPPQETGLTCNSWNGKFHLEMHWWHAAHFPMWDRAPLLERSLKWYTRILDSARGRARSQGYKGARWPKMVGPDGIDSPSPIGPLLIWQQPHPIVLAEYCYQARPVRSTLQHYRDLVMESADFMASYAYFEAARDRYVLGPPVIPAQENHPPNETWNPTFELEYWHHALGIAAEWRERLNLAPRAEWAEVRGKLAVATVRDGVYMAHENCPQTFTERNRDHPSMLMAMGMLPGARIDREVMRATLHRVFRDWRWEDTWGWDFPMVAMTAARLGQPERALDALFINSPKNKWLANGHNWQRANLPLYLPGNGALLAAIAMMAAGWNGAPEGRTAPGFPQSWKVRWEGLRGLL